MPDDPVQGDPSASRLREILSGQRPLSVTLPEHEVEQRLAEFDEVASSPLPAPLRSLIGVLQAPQDAFFAAEAADRRGEGAAGVIREIGQALLLKRRGTAQRQIEKTIPQKGVVPTIERMVAGFATDPMVLAQPIGAVPAAAGLATRAITKSLAPVGKLLAKGAYATRTGGKATDLLRTWFSRAGATAESAAIREVLDKMEEKILAHLVDDVGWASGIDQGADDIAAHASKQLGRQVSGDEFARLAFDYTENALRQPERFAGMPQVVKDFSDQYAAIARRAFDDLHATETGAGVKVPYLGGEESAARLAKLNHDISEMVDQTVLDPAYLPNQVTDYGVKFFGLNRDQISDIELLGASHPSVAKIAGKDAYAKARGFLNEQGTRLGAVEKNELARAGKLPGYEGQIAKRDLYATRPLEAMLPRLISGHRATEEMLAAKTIAEKFGRHVPDVAARRAASFEGLVPVSETHPLLSEYMFPPALAKELKYGLPLLQARGPIARWALRVGGEANRLFMENLLLLPSTIGRNWSDEVARSVMLGAGMEEMADASRLTLGLWNPLRWGLERARVDPKWATKLRGLSLARLEGISEGKLVLNRAPSKWTVQGIPVGTLDAGGLRGSVNMTPQDVIKIAFSKNVVGRGWSLTDVQDIASAAFRRFSDPKAWHYIFRKASWLLTSENFLPVKLLRRAQNMGDDVPRLASFLHLLRRGMTPDEAALEMAKFHPGIKLTPFERQIVGKVIPFYRWNKFAQPFSVRMLFKHPEYLYLGDKLFRYMSLGTQPVDERDVPGYVRRMFGVPIDERKLPDGKRMIGWTGPGGFLSIYSALQFLGDGNASDEMWSLLHPLLTSLADAVPGEAKDDVFLGVRMNSKVSQTLRRVWRFGNILDKMALPKGLSAEEKSFRRKQALMQLMSPLPFAVGVEGQEIERKKAAIRGMAYELRNRVRRSVAPTGRIRGTIHEPAVIEEAEKQKRNLEEMLKELQ